MAKRRTLSETFIRKAAPGKHHDGGGLGLILRVREGGSRQFVQRLRVGGRAREIGLGGWPIVSLEEARELAFENKRMARRGEDPLAVRRADRAPTFEEALSEAIRLHEPTWKAGGKTAALWRSSMAAYVLPRLGRKRVDQISAGDILAVLTPIWSTKRATASKLKRRIATVMRWAVAQGHCEADPTAAVASALPRDGARTSHYRAVPHGELAAALATVRASGAGLSTKAVIEFIALTACRSGEARGARWEEVDVEAATWTIPAERTKSEREHVVPLSTAALAILEEARGLADGSGLIFPGSRYGRALTDSTLSKLLRELGIAGTVHGLRSSFRDWAAESGVAREVAEAALAHIVAGTEGAYFRSDLLDRRRPVMEAWAAYLSPASAGNVEDMGEHRRRA